MNHCGDSSSHMTSRPQDDLPTLTVSQALMLFIIRLHGAQKNHPFSAQYMLSFHCWVGVQCYIYVGERKEICVPPELSVLADGHHDQQVSQDAHQHDQRQEADQSHPLWHAVAMETPKKDTHQFRSAEENKSLYL